MSSLTRIKRKQGLLLLLALLVCQLWGSAQNPPAVASEDSFSYLWDEVRVRLEIDPSRVAIFVPEIEDLVFAAERELRKLGITDQIDSFEETPYPGLLVLHLKYKNAADVLLRLDAISSGWAAPCLSYRGRLHIPRPEILITLDPDDREAYDRVLSHPDLLLIGQITELQNHR